ncbi:hypothetical protein GOP47_0016203 [Adiantum capillus-veneris]|uniref:Uncharacterized protein n=1 Tax=Adiantum capillus-veneris TaxID=13818 RepID=A0A9D4UH62_ADICA|nr:hypothetical protein GOP47_0016203 [Adiantum capillus-veneris]
MAGAQHDDLNKSNIGEEGAKGLQELKDLTLSIEQDLSHRSVKELETMVHQVGVARESIRSLSSPKENLPARGGSPGQRACNTNTPWTWKAKFGTFGSSSVGSYPTKQAHPPNWETWKKASTWS